MEVLTTVQDMDLYANSNRTCEYRCKGLCRCDYVTETDDGPMNHDCASVWHPRQYSIPRPYDIRPSRRRQHDR